MKKITFKASQQNLQETKIDLCRDSSDSPPNFAGFSDGQCSIIALVKKAHCIDVVV